MEACHKTNRPPEVSGFEKRKEGTGKDREGM